MDWNDWLTLGNSLGTAVEIGVILWAASRFGAFTKRVLRKRKGKG